ncbi:hypothetical protein B0H34DRAFT_676387 [Crassisporium funariophilum]|nr:hypothetical protein B0H34DRAFT_676387 [Crassisporium funariophilum]
MCKPRGLLQQHKIRDIPLVTLIKETTIHHNVQVLTGNSGITVMEKMHLQHLLLSHGNKSGKHLFRTRTTSSVCGVHLELKDNLYINEITKQALVKLGDKGRIWADGHACSECIQPYKHTSVNNHLAQHDPAGIVDDHLQEARMTISVGNTAILHHKMVLLQIVVAYDNNGVPYQKCAFACGFDSIFRCMTPGNFNWFLHTMLFYHTQYVPKRQFQKEQRQGQEDSDSKTSDSENSGSDTKI